MPEFRHRVVDFIRASNKLLEGEDLLDTKRTCYRTATAQELRTGCSAGRSA
jgi:hypothetical protein